MQIARRFTTEGRDPYETVGFRSAASEIRNPDGSVVFSAEGVEVPAEWSQVACDILAQKYLRKAGVPARLARGRGGRACRPGCGAARADTAALAALPKSRAQRRRDQRQAMLRPARRHLDLLGLEGRLFRQRSRRPRLLRRDPGHAGAPDGGAELAAMVQHRALLGLRHRRPGAGPLLRRSPHRQGARLRQRLRAPAAARLLHPVGRRRPRQRGRHHGSLGARGAAVQIRLRHRLQFLEAARRRREAVGRRPLVRADELSEDRRPRRRRDQIGRHDAARRQDGHRRRRPPRYRGTTSTGRSSRSRRSPRWSPARSWPRST